MGARPWKKQQVITKARERRLELDHNRAERDRRVEDAIAEVLLQLEERTAAQHAVQAANLAIGAGLRRLLEDENIGVEGVGRLVDLTVSEVRRLARTVPSPPAPAGAGEQPSPAAGGHLATVPPLEQPDQGSARLPSPACLKRRQTEGDGRG